MVRLRQNQSLIYGKQNECPRCGDQGYNPGNCKFKTQICHACTTGTTVRIPDISSVFAERKAGKTREDTISAGDAHEH